MSIETLRVETSKKKLVVLPILSLSHKFKRLFEIDNMFSPQIDDEVTKELKCYEEHEAMISKLYLDLWDTETDTKELSHKLQEIKEENRLKIEKFEQEMKSLTSSIRENMKKDIKVQRENMQTEKSFVEKRLEELTERYSSYWNSLKNKVDRAVVNFTTDRY